MRVHNVDGIALVDQDTTNVEVRHSGSDEQGNRGIWSTAGQFLQVEGDRIRFSSEFLQSWGEVRIGANQLVKLPFYRTDSERAGVTAVGDDHCCWEIFPSAEGGRHAD